MSSSAIQGQIFNDPSKAADGSAASPSFSFANSTSTGVYRVSANTLGISTAGVQRVVVSSTGSVGIGTASPSHLLHLRGTADVILNVESAAAAYTSRLRLNAGGAGASVIDALGGDNTLIMTTNNTERMRLDASGRLLVGLTSPTFGSGAGICISNPVIALQLRNPAAAAGKGYNVGPGSSNEFVIYNQNSTGVYIADNGTGWLANSDERLKKNIKPLELGLDQIKALKPARFDYKTDESEDSTRVGFIAQEVLPVLPHAVHVPEDSEKMMGVSATEIIPVLVKAIQELEARLAALESK